MALPLGKLSILVGAGLLGSVLAKEGHFSGFTDLVSGAFKIAFKQIKRGDATSSVSKPHNDSLMAQVNSLRQELQMLASNRPVTIVTATGSGASRYGAVVVVVVVGYGYVWWKGWKLSDMMFATKRNLSDACTSMAQQLENVYGSIRSVRRELSSSIDRVDNNLNDIAGITANTQGQATELLEDSTRIGNNVRNVHNVVETLELKISRIEEKQYTTIQGVKTLFDFKESLENNTIEGNTQASRITFSSKGYLPFPSSEPTSPSVSSGSLEVQQTRQSAALTTAQQQSNGISGAVEVSSTRNSDGLRALDETNNSSSSRFTPFLQRMHSVTNAVLQQTSYSRQQSR